MPSVTWGGMGNPAGRPERVGNILLPFDPTLKGPRFSMAGTGVPWSPDDSGITSFSLLDSACADADFMDGVVSGIYTEIENFLSSQSAAVWPGRYGDDSVVPPQDSDVPVLNSVRKTRIPLQIPTACVGYRVRSP